MVVKLGGINLRVESTTLKMPSNEEKTNATKKRHAQTWKIKEKQAKITQHI